MIKLIIYLVMVGNVFSEADYVYEDPPLPSPPAMPPYVPPVPDIWTTKSPEYTSDMCRTLDSPLPEFVDYKEYEHYTAYEEGQSICRSCVDKCGNTAGECKS